jgi:hypothetical protein
VYVATTVARSELAQDCFASKELAEACTLTTAAHSSQSDLVQALADRSSVLAKYPAWSAKQRPASAMQQLELQWELPLQTLQTVVEHHFTENSRFEIATGTKGTWQGDQFQLRLLIRKGSTDGQMCVHLGCFLISENASAAVRHVTYFLKTLQTSSRHFDTVGPCTDTFYVGNLPGRDQCTVRLGQVSSWAAVEARLRDLGLVHSDGCLHLQGLVTNII